MSNFTSYPRQDLYETQLSQAITAVQVTIAVVTAPSFTLSSGSCYAVIDPEGTAEIVEITGISSTTLTVTRGIVLFEGGSSSAAAHAAGVPVIISDNWKTFDDIQTAIASKADTAGDTFTGEIAFTGTDHAGAIDISLTTAQRTALTGVNGMKVYDTDLGERYQYIGGAWSAVAAGSTQPNASETVAGKVELATQAEVDAGTDTGGTGAPTVAVPSKIAAAIQSGTFMYAVDTGVADAYVIALTPAVTSLVAGQLFAFLATNANAGASTLDPNGLGPEAIKKFHDQDLEPNDIESGSIVLVQYDGTNFQMLNQAVDENWTAPWTIFGNVTTPVTVANTVTETALFTKEVPANFLSTGNVITGRLYASDFGITTSGAGSLLIDLQYGTTTLATVQIGPPSGVLSGGEVWIDFMLCASGATNSQKATLAVEFTQRGGALTTAGQIDLTSTHTSNDQWRAFDYGTSAEDSTGALDLKVTAQWTSANASNTITLEHGVVQLVTVNQQLNSINP